MRPDRVVLDANVFISAAINGRTEVLAAFLVEHEVFAYTCIELLGEVERNLKDQSLNKYLACPVEEIMQVIREVTFDIEIDLRFDRAPDVNDNYLFDLAYAVKASHLVTGDKLLLNMKHMNQVQIISPATFFKLFNTRW